MSERTSGPVDGTPSAGTARTPDRPRPEGADADRTAAGTADADRSGTPTTGASRTGTGTTDAGAEWRSRRREAADAHEAALRARRQGESARARELIAAFVTDATERGVAPEPLQAQGYGGKGRFRTPLRGWYLRRDRTVAVGTDGGFYVLTVPPSLSARLRGVAPEPQDPPLVLGAGGKDGESLDLTIALARALGDPEPPTR